MVRFLVASLLSVLLLLPPPAFADDASLVTVNGGGYGHGYGMSQYGAQGAALQGLTHTQILAFYYPGTELANATGRVRVWISHDTDNKVTVPAQTGLAVRTASRTVRLPSSPRAWRMRNNADGLILERKTARGWVNSLRSVGVEKPVRGKFEFFVRDGAVKLKTSDGTSAYRGALRAVPFQARTLTVNVVDLESYVRGIIAREMPAYWETEALAAQAVAARTYAVRERAGHNTYYDLCDTAACQVYGGVSAETSPTDAAVRSVRGEVLTYDDEYALTQFSASNGGYVKRGSQPYLVAKSDPYDGWTGNPYREWTKIVDGAALASKYDLGTFESLTIVSTEGPYPTQVRLTGSLASRTFDGYEFRNAADLLSPLFSF